VIGPPRGTAHPIVVDHPALPVVAGPAGPGDRPAAQAARTPSWVSPQPGKPCSFQAGVAERGSGREGTCLSGGRWRHRPNGLAPGDVRVSRRVSRWEEVVASTGLFTENSPYRRVAGEGLMLRARRRRCCCSLPIPRSRGASPSTATSRGIRARGCLARFSLSTPSRSGPARRPRPSAPRCGERTSEWPGPVTGLTILSCRFG
jgi:hypothetical protein